MTSVDRVLEALDIDYTTRNDNAQALCPMHERITGTPDHNPSWFIHVETGQHICFSCGYKGNLVQLVCDVHEFYISSQDNVVMYDYAAGNRWLAAATDVSVEELREALAKVPQYVSPPPKPLPMSEARLAIFVEPPQYALDSRNVSAESAHAFGVLWNKNTETWILPIRDADNNRLMGWQEKGTVDRTFKNRPAGVQKSKTLFGHSNMHEEYVVVVESPLDCLRLYSAGIASAVATFGAIVSDAQVKLLRYPEKVIAAFDNPNLDAAGKKASDQMRDFARKYGINLFFFNYGDSGKKDPGDMTDEEIIWGVENAKPAILGESAYVYGNAQTVSS
jgi:hypothetical protein